MILRALYDLAIREQLDPFYEPKEVHYLIHLDRDGKFLGITEPREDAPLDAKGRPRGKPRASRRPIPRRSERSAQNLAEFLVDKGEYVFGLEPQAEAARSPEKTKALADRAAIRQTLFRERVEAALRDPRLAHNAGLRALVAFLQTDAERRDARFTEWLSAKTAANPKELDAGLFAFVHEPDGGAACVHDHPDVRAYWTDTLASAGDAARGQCLVTGREDVPLTRLHAAPKGIPPVSDTKGGVPLTSVNKDAFQSYGLAALGCAPVSVEATRRIDAALTRLLDPAYPGADGNPLPRRCVGLSRDTTIVYWSREDAELDFIASLDAADPEQVAALLHAPHAGRPAALDDPADFYALVLSGMQGRGIVRGFIESTVRDVAAGVDRYFNEACIVRPFGREPGSYPLLHVRQALVFEGDLKRLPPDMGTRLYLAILQGRALPRALFDAAVRRNKADLLPDRGPLRGIDALAARCSLIKAYLIRNSMKEVSVSLDASRQEPAYRLGRLLAVVDKIQADALGSVNASLVDRYYGSASCTPAAVLPTLVRRCQHHLGKLRRDKPSWAVNHEKRLQEVMGGLDRFPAVLGLEDQGLFALGFYHQRQDFYVKKEGEN